MTKRFILSRSIMGLLFISIVAIVPLLISMAQKTADPKKIESGSGDDEKQRVARNEISKSIVGSDLVSSLETGELPWKLEGAQYLEKHDRNDAATIQILFKRGDTSAGVSISQCGSVVEADAQFQAVRSYGASVPFNKFGEKGDKLIGNKGDLLGIRFRKGSFFVVIFSRDLPTAERFAELALGSLNRTGMR